jgi:hypothetical protein
MDSLRTRIEQFVERGLNPMIVAHVAVRQSKDDTINAPHQTEVCLFDAAV